MPWHLCTVSAEKNALAAKFNLNYDNLNWNSQLVETRTVYIIVTVIRHFKYLRKVVVHLREKTEAQKVK